MVAVFNDQKDVEKVGWIVNLSKPLDKSGGNIAFAVKGYHDRHDGKAGDEGGAGRLDRRGAQGGECGGQFQRHRQDKRDNSPERKGKQDDAGCKEQGECADGQEAEAKTGRDAERAAAFGQSDAGFGSFGELRAAGLNDRGLDLGGRGEGKGDGAKGGGQGIPQGADGVGIGYNNDGQAATALPGQHTMREAKIGANLVDQAGVGPVVGDIGEAEAVQAGKGGVKGGFNGGVAGENEVDQPTGLRSTT